MFFHWKPKITQILDFGDSSYPWNSIYPTDEQLLKLPHEKKILLKSITYSQNLDVFELASI